MKQKNKLKKMLIWVVLLLPMLLVLKPEGVQATHFRYGHLTWQPLSPTGTSVRFTLTCAFRRDGFFGTAGDGFVAVGDTFNEEIGATNLIFGDGTNTGILEFKVISIDPPNNWCLALALEPTNYSKTTIDHTYLTSTNGGAPWLAEINTCCRTDFEVNNPDGPYRVSTLVETASGNRSPVSSLPAIVNLPQTTNASFLVPAADPDANTNLRWRLATPDEAGDSTKSFPVLHFAQPTGLTIDNLTGLVSWNTLVNATIGGLYSCQVIIEDINSITGGLKTRVAVDFLIFITPQSSPCDVDLPPYFYVPAPSPGIAVCGNTYTIHEGQPLSFTMHAADPDIGNTVTLNSGGGPNGSTFTPNLPTTGNPVSSTFSWTPGAGTAGSYVVTFTATDSCGAQALCSSTINVLANACNLHIGCRTIQPTCWNSCDGSESISVTGGSGQYGFLWSNGQTTSTATGLCVGTYTVTVTDLVTQCTKSKVAILKKAKVGHKFTITNATCGFCNGSLTVGGTGGNGGPYTFLWSTGATTATIGPLCPANYTVTITDSRGCTTVCHQKIVNKIIANCPSRITDEENSGAKQIVTYPNPFSDRLNVDVITDEDLTISVKDITGRVINVYMNVNRSFVIDASLNNGMYFLDIQNESGSYKQVLKVIKTN